MKTLGDTGLMPKKKHTFNCVDECDCKDLEFNKAIDQLSAIPILAVVEKALELGLIKIEICGRCVGFGKVRNLTVVCSDCKGRGFTITEGGKK